MCREMSQSAFATARGHSRPLATSCEQSRPLATRRERSRHASCLGPIMYSVLGKCQIRSVHLNFQTFVLLLISRKAEGRFWLFNVSWWLSLLVAVPVLTVVHYGLLQNNTKVWLVNLKSCIDILTLCANRHAGAPVDGTVTLAHRLMVFFRWSTASGTL